MATSRDSAARRSVRASSAASSARRLLVTATAASTRATSGEDHDRAEQLLQSAGTAPLALRLGCGRASAGREELALGRVEHSGPVRVPRPRRGGREPGAAPEVARVAPRLRPRASGVGQLAVQLQPLAVLGDPVLDPGPCGQQRLVADLDRLGVRGQQPGGDEGLEHVSRGIVVVPGVNQLLPSDAAPYDEVVLDGDQPQKQRLREPLAASVQRVVDAVRRLRDGSVQAAARLVVGEGDHAVLGPFPHGPENVGEQWQRPGVVGVCGAALGCAEVEQESVDEIGCQLDTGPAGGLGDRQAEVTARHRADHDLGSLEHGHRAPRRLPRAGRSRRGARSPRASTARDPRSGRRTPRVPAPTHG